MITRWAFDSEASGIDRLAGPHTSDFNSFHPGVRPKFEVGFGLTDSVKRQEGVHCRSVAEQGEKRRWVIM